VTPVTPTAEPATSTNKQGQTQTGKPSFTAGHENVPMNDEVPATFEDGSTKKEILGVGIYTVAADGTVTFTPDPRFVGEAPAVTVVREDMNGTKASATYTFITDKGVVPCDNFLYFVLVLTTKRTINHHIV
jgi:large repetitive protein